MGIPTGYTFKQMSHKLRLSALEEEAAAKVVVPGDQERGDGLHGLVADAQKRDTHKHVQVVETQTNHRQDGEDRELALAAHALAMVEHVLHTEPVVDHDGRDKRDRGAHQKVEMEQLDERNEHAPVDAKGDKTHDSELEELLSMRLCQCLAHVITSNTLMNRAEDTLELLQGKRKGFAKNYTNSPNLQETIHKRYKSFRKRAKPTNNAALDARRPWAP